ncbi:c-type cytochrome [Chitinophagaceae bacterium LB-8]|uniref:C-type cytochrome n=1 Tax=Paraflavisolibacter caeni TaxID=2982496 RepID=A0A9X2XUJ7_9BACT|nr:c-type cytochrome [Paraflavisolibacter caeni]MCU7548890.1 c-type cytochrome [Paraflavisolibacter caeni]
MRTLNHALFAVIILALISGCSSNESKTKEKDISAVRQHESDDMVARGEYLVTVSGCHDCHSPKIFNEKGMSLDSTKLLSGHPSTAQLPPIPAIAHQPGQWIIMSPDLTAFLGPWGTSYTANLTPDSATGTGTWSEENFINAIRTGKHMGQENGRPIMPPMPWEFIRKMTDEDLKSVFAYLRSLPPVNNRVPAPTPPPAAAAAPTKTP